MELNFKANQGQALMMMVMVMFVGLTMVLIIFMNSLSNLQLSTTEEQSERAFNISEAGIEKLLAQDDPVSGSGPNAVVSDITGVVNAEGENDYKYTINKNDTGEIQLTGVATDGNVDIYWTNAADTDPLTGENPDPSDACKAAGMIIEKWSMGTPLPSPTTAPTVAPTTAPVCTDDTYEQNDSLAAATNITVTMGSTSSVNGKICYPDEDYFKFPITVPTGGSVSIQLTLTNSSHNLGMILYNPWGMNINSKTTRVVSPATLQQTVTASGWYKVEVYGVESFTSASSYTLAIKPSSVLGVQTSAVLGVCTGVTTQEAGSAYKVTRYVYQPFSCGEPLAGIIGVVWDTALSDPSGDFKSMATIPVTPDDIMLRVRPIYNKATIQALSEDANPLPIQLHNIESSAQVDVSGEARALQVVRTVPQLPSIFDYVLFSGEEAIVKE